MSGSVIPPMPLRFVVGDNEWIATPKRFSSGSVGWYSSTKLEVEGTRVQVSLSVVVIGSKPRSDLPGQTQISFQQEEEKSPTIASEPSGDQKQPKTRKKALERG